MLAVSDSGVGIPKDKLEAVFEKFTQADASTTRKYGGTGLGLAICRTIVEQMGGSIHVTSEKGNGTTFRVVLPLRVAKTDEAEPEETMGKEEPVLAIAPEPEEPADAPESKSKPQMHGKDAPPRILLVEDYEPNILVATTLIDGYGYACDVARNGTEAVHRFNDAEYDLILMDMQMPEMDGFETTRRIRSLESAHEDAATPIIAMTAFAMSGDREKCMAAGADDYISKPFDPDQLKEKMEAWIKMGKQAME